MKKTDLREEIITLEKYIKQLKAGPVWRRATSDPATHPAIYPVLAIGYLDARNQVYKETFRIYEGELWRHIYDFDVPPEDT